MWGGDRLMGNGPKDFLEISITFFFIIIYYNLLYINILMWLIVFFIMKRKYKIND